jgi:hypothetical protein
VSITDEQAGRVLAEEISFILNGNMKRRKFYVADQTNVNLITA